MLVGMIFTDSILCTCRLVKRQHIYLGDFKFKKMCSVLYCFNSIHSQYLRSARSSFHSSKPNPATKITNLRRGGHCYACQGKAIPIRPALLKKLTTKVRNVYKRIQNMLGTMNSIFTEEHVGVYEVGKCSPTPQLKPLLAS